MRIIMLNFLLLCLSMTWINADPITRPTDKATEIHHSLLNLMAKNGRNYLAVFTRSDKSQVFVNCNQSCRNKFPIATYYAAFQACNSLFPNHAANVEICMLCRVIYRCGWAIRTNPKVFGGK